MYNGYPLAPEKLAINHTMLSNYCCSITSEYNINVGVNKLIPNLGNKSKYVLHYKNLQLYLSLEMKLTKVDKVLKFKQSNWLKNTLIFIQRKVKMQPKFLKNISSKLMNNSVYVKTMETFKTKMYVRLAINVKDYKNCVSKPSFLIKIDKIFNKNFVAIHEFKLVLTLDKPIYAGFSILDLSQLLMYEVHYNYIKKK